MRAISIRRSIYSGTARMFLFGAMLCLVWTVSARADVVADWDVIAFDAIDASGATGPTTALPITMAHVAMHDALNAINRRYEPYAYDAVGPKDASPEAAVAAAAYGVLVVEIPNQRPMLDAALASALATIPNGKA